MPDALLCLVKHTHRQILGVGLQQGLGTMKTLNKCSEARPKTVGNQVCVQVVARSKIEFGLYRLCVTRRYSGTVWNIWDWGDSPGDEYMHRNIAGFEIEAGYHVGKMKN